MTTPAGSPEALTSGTPEVDASDDDLAWMFGEGPVSSIARSGEDHVGRALDDLVGDWLRTGGHLTRAEVALTAARRKFSPTQHGELLDLLEQAGVDLLEVGEARPKHSAPKGYEIDEDLVGHYLQTIGRHALIGAGREVELWSLISSGAAARHEFESTSEGPIDAHLRRSLLKRIEAGRQAHAELVCANLRLVVSIAKMKKYQASGVEFADRIQDGNLGLMHAADKFDGSKGFKFSTYASWWIRASIERGIGDRGRTIRIPIHLNEKLQRVRKARSSLTTRLERDPTLTELCEETGLDAGTVQAARDLMRPLISLDMLLGDEGDLHLSDVLTTEDQRDGRADPAEIAMHAMFSQDLSRTLAKHLPERAVRVLERRFGIGTGEAETLEEIGLEFAVTRERIRQIQNMSLATLRESDHVSGLRSYLNDDSAAGSTSISAGGKAS